MDKATLIPMRATDTHGLAELLRADRDLVAATEPKTRAWYGLRSEHDPRDVGIFDTFAPGGREAHFAGQVAAALRDEAPRLVDGGWRAVLASVDNYELLAALERPGAAPPRKATLITLRAAEGQANALAGLLTGGRDVVAATEPATLCWYALQSEEDPRRFAIFDLFLDDTGRAAHFGGQVAAALRDQAALVVEGGWERGVVANLRNYEVIADKLG